MMTMPGEQCHLRECSCYVSLINMQHKHKILSAARVCACVVFIWCVHFGRWIGLCYKCTSCTTPRPRHQRSIPIHLALAEWLGWLPENGWLPVDVSVDETFALHPAIPEHVADNTASQTRIPFWKSFPQQFDKLHERQQRKTMYRFIAINTAE